MRVRSAGPADAEAIAQIEALAAAHPWTLAAVQGTLAQPTTVALVAEDGLVVGHILATAVADEGEVLTVATLPDRRRQGIGRALLLATERIWRARSVCNVFLDVRRDNQPAIALYLALGWRTQGVRAAYYPDGTDALQLTRVFE